MDNDATKALNPEQQSQAQDATRQQTSENKNKHAARAASAAAGAAVGSGVAYAAGHIYDHATAEPETPHAEPVQTEAPAAPQPTQAAPPAQQAPVQEAPAQEVPAQEAPAQAATTTGQGTGASDSIPSNGSYIDERDTTTDVDADNEVRVVGMGVQDNGNGGMATLAVLQQGEEMAVLVDVDTDGTIDIMGVDENHNGHIEQEEWHDVSDANMRTARVVETYVEQSHENGQQAIVTNYDDGSHYQITQGEDGFELASVDDAPTPGAYEAANDISNDGMPDYMNDADAGIMDA